MRQIFTHIRCHMVRGLVSAILFFGLITLLLTSLLTWAQRVTGPPTLEQSQHQLLQPDADGEDNEPIEDDPTARQVWMRERFGGDAPGMQSDPLVYKDMMLRETERQKALYPQLAPGIRPASPIPAWVSVGPTSGSFETNGVTLNVIDSGRARTILPDPSDQNTVYFLTSGGGLWKTTNFLQTNPTWTPKTDGLPTTGGGSVAFGRTSNVLYLGLGDPFDVFPLAGGVMVKSIDGGDTWSVPISLLY